MWDKATSLQVRLRLCAKIRKPTWSSRCSWQFSKALWHSIFTHVTSKFFRTKLTSNSAEYKPSLLAALSRDQFPWIFGIGKTSQETLDTTLLSEANYKSPKTPVPESDGEDKTITPNSLETPHFLCITLELPMIFFVSVIICKLFWCLYMEKLKCFWFFSNLTCFNLFSVFQIIPQART